MLNHMANPKSCNCTKFYFKSFLLTLYVDHRVYTFNWKVYFVFFSFCSFLLVHCCLMLVGVCCYSMLVVACHFFLMLLVTIINVDVHNNHWCCDWYKMWLVCHHLSLLPTTNEFYLMQTNVCCWTYLFFIFFE